MGNDIKVVKADGQSKYVFNKVTLRVGNLNLMEFFPMFKKCITTEAIKNNLLLILKQQSANKVIFREALEIKLGQYTSMLELDPSIFPKLIEEHFMSEQLKSIFNTAYSELLTYDLSMRHFMNIAKKLGINNGIIHKIIEHPDVDSLYLSIILGDEKLVTRYLKFGYSNNIIQHYLLARLTKSNTNISSLIAVVIAKKICLCIEVYRLLSSDILTYVKSRNVLYI